MALTININGLTLCHKASDGVATATVPDVCKTPPIPVPVPYPNIAFSKDLAKGTRTIKVDGGHMAANFGSEFSMSIGDEPGVAGGVISSTNMKEATWITYSFDVKFEGKGACRLTDKMFMNHGNTVCCGGLFQKFLAKALGDILEACKAMLQRIKDLIGEGVTGKTADSIRGLEERMAQQITGEMSPTDGPGSKSWRPPNAEYPSGSNGWQRHNDEIEAQKKNLERHLDEYDQNCKGGTPVPANAREWAKKKAPAASEYVGPSVSPLLGAAMVVGGAVLVVGAAIGVAALVADDATGVGVADDVAIPPVAGAGVYGWGMIARGLGGLTFAF